MDVIQNLGVVDMEVVVYLKKKNDCNLIRIAELDPVLKAITLPLRWELWNVEIQTDSVTVLG